MAHDDNHEECLLDLCKPPDGYEFKRGLWCTHDLAMRVVTDLVMPELLGAQSRTGGRRREEAAALADNSKYRLLILHAAGRFTPGPAFPSVVRPIAVGGKRRLHAKFALLQFEKIKGTGAWTRAFLTSANLTAGGVQDNRELIVWEDVRRKSSETLCRDLLILFKTLADSLPTERAEIEEIRMAILRNGLSAGRKTGQLIDSIDEPREMTAKLPSLKQVSRIVIVTPPFGTDHSDRPARLLEPYLRSRPSVDIYVGVDSQPDMALAPAFSRAAHRYLHQHASKVRLMAVPERLPSDEEDEDHAPERRRYLHAKLLAVVDKDGNAHVLVGSANFTDRGMRGKNQETMVYLPRREDMLDDFLSKLRATEWRGEPVPPIPPSELDGEIPLGQIVTATFEARSGVTSAQPRWPGILRMTWQQAPEKISYLRRGGDQPLLLVKEQPLVLDPQRTGLKVQYGDHDYDVHIHVHIAEGEDGFWAHPPADDEERPDHGLWMLLSDLRRPLRTRPGESQPPIEGAGSKNEDGFSIPLEQRLVLLARNRRSLNTQLDGKEVFLLLEKYLQGNRKADPFVVDTGRALLSAYFDDVEKPKAPLLKALRACLEEFHERH